MKKQCSGCGQVKTIEQFYRNRNRPDGRHDWCKTCHKSTVKEPSELDNLIINTLESLSSIYDRIFPYMVQAAIGLIVGERALRRNMARLATQGRIIRVGERSGYLPLPVGKFDFSR